MSAFYCEKSFARLLQPDSTGRIAVCDAAIFNCNDKPALQKLLMATANELRRRRNNLKLLPDSPDALFIDHAITKIADIAAIRDNLDDHHWELLAATISIIASLLPATPLPE